MLKIFLVYNKKENNVVETYFHPDIKQDNETMAINKFLDNIKNVKYQKNERVQYNIKNLGVWYTEKCYKRYVFCVYTDNVYKARIAFQFIKESIKYFAKKNKNEIENLVKQYHKLEFVDNITKLKNKVNEGINVAKETIDEALIYEQDLDDFKKITIELEENAKIFIEETGEIKDDMKEKNRRMRRLIFLGVGCLILIIIVIIVIFKII